MLRRLVIAAAVLVLGVGAGASLGLQSPATAQPAVDDCPDRMPSDTASLVCRCGSNSLGGGTIWGSDVYTADSALCRAAVHSGVIGASGGVVEVRELPGRSSYPAVDRNGVSSGSWASYPRSITFTGARSTQTDDCPSTLPSDTPSMVCRCRSDAIGSSTIWGSTVYTADSSICRAAVHAGAIGAGGGIVEVREAPGRSSYPGVSRNGISSSSWATFPRSITFGETK